MGRFTLDYSQMEYTEWSKYTTTAPIPIPITCGGWILVASTPQYFNRTN